MKAFPPRFAIPDLTFDVLRGGGQPIDLVYRRVLINDIIARADECSALVKA